MKLLPWHSFAIASLRSLIAGITFVVYMLLKHFRFIFNRQTLLTGIMTGCVYVCFSAANKLTTAANAIVLQFTCPVFVLLFSALFFHKKIRKIDLTVVFPTRRSSDLTLGVLQLGISYILYVKASQLCPPLACSLLSAAEPLLNPLWVMIFDGERPGTFALIG